MMLTRLIKPLFLSLTLAACTPDALRAPSLEDNKLFSTCTEQLAKTFAAVKVHKADMPTLIKQRVSSLLMAAEIDGQFKHYPACVNKLERARFFLEQARLALPKDPPPSPAVTPPLR